MAMPKIRAVITADTAQAEAGFERVERGLNDVGGAADRAGQRTNRMSRTLAGTTRTSSGFSRGIQNASFQLGDFATQVGAGTSASIALGQQLPQLLGGFGVLGAVLGAVAAVAVPLTRAFQGLSEQGTDMTQVFGTLAPVMERIGDTFRTIGQIGVQAAELIINNLDRILITAGGVAAFFAGRYVAAFVAARVATFTLAGALATLRVALIRTGIGALIVGAGELAFQFSRLVRAAGSFGEAMTLLGEVAGAVWQGIIDSAQAIPPALNGVWALMKAGFLNALSDMAFQFSDFAANLASNVGQIPGMKGVAGALFDASLAASNAGGRIGGSGEQAQSEADAAFGRASEIGKDAFAPAREGIQELRDLMASIKDDKITLPDLLGTASDEESGGGKSAAEKTKEQLSEQEQAIRDHFQRVKDLTEGSLGERLGAWGNYFQNLVQLTGSNNQKLLGLAKSFAAAEALVNAWKAYNQVIADPSLPWYAKLAAGAQVLAAGLGAVNAIKSVSAGGNSSGGGGRSGGGGGGGAPAPQNTTYFVNLQGDSFSRQSVEQAITTVLQKRLDRGDRLVFSRAGR